jgi:tetratricopeptide (TPR) repeat protein
MPQSRFLRKTVVNTYIQSQEFEKALSFFQDSQFSELDSEEKRSLSLIYVRTGELAKAAEVIESLGSEKGAEEIYSLALLYESIGLKEQSLKSFREFFKDNERTFDVGVKLVQFNIGENKLAQAHSIALILHECFPENADALSLLGTVNYLNRDTAKAEEHFNAALAIDSLNEEALRTLAHIYVVKEQYGEAVSAYKRLVSLDENGAVYRRGLAFMLFHTKDFEGAEALLDTILSEKTERPPVTVQELHLYRGLIYSQTQRQEKAAQEFEAALSIDSLYEDAWKELCFLSITSKDKEKASACVERYTAAFPGSSTAWRFSGYVFNMKKEYEQAVRSLKKAVNIDPADHFAWFELGSAFERLKRIDEAADAFRETLKINPDDSHASNYLGYMWAENGMMLDSAKLLIENALLKEPQNGAFLDSYGWVFYQIGDYEKARRYLEEALKHIDDDPVPYEHLGDVLFKLREYKEAAAAYKRSLEFKSEESARIEAKLLEIKNIIGK